MKLRILLLLICLYGCEKPCLVLENNCIDYCLIPEVNVANSPDLISYLLKDDSTYYFNGDSFYAEGIKFVPTQGFIPWKANCAFYQYDNKIGIYLRNYGDTTNWRYLFEIAYLREQLLIFNFKLELGKKQLIFSDDIYSQNPNNLLLGRYGKTGGHGDLLDAIWSEDNDMESTIELTKIDTINNILEGNFDLYFTLHHWSPGSPFRYANEAHFRCGKFRAVMLE